MKGLEINGIKVAEYEFDGKDITNFNCILPFEDEADKETYTICLLSIAYLIEAFQSINYGNS